MNVTAHFIFAITSQSMVRKFDVQNSYTRRTTYINLARVMLNELADAIRSRLKTERSEAEWEPQPFLFDDVDEFWHSAYLPYIQAKKKPHTVSGYK